MITLMVSSSGYARRPLSPHSTVEFIHECLSVLGTRHFPPGPTTTRTRVVPTKGCKGLRNGIVHSHFQLTAPFNQVLYIIAAYVF